jgi:cytochrome c biogenesis protein CcdA
MFYNMIYVVPLAAIITLFGYFFKGKQISKEQMGIIKVIGGLIMIMLGIILIFNPGLLMLV